MRWQTLQQGLWFIVGLAAASIAALYLVPWLAALPGVLLLFTLWFFRDPPRLIPAAPDVVVSPADGRITDIIEIEETEVTHQRMQRVGIFLSVFDVHVNRAPIDSRVSYTADFHGVYHDARSPAASTHNTARTWGFVSPEGLTLVVRQITGAIARRIVPWAKMNQNLRRGEHFGMIRFGSRTEIYLPLDAKLEVKVGQHVRGGSSILARLS
jgi:phosphatidylserine decarboxylase